MGIVNDRGIMSSSNFEPEQIFLPSLYAGDTIFYLLELAAGESSPSGRGRTVQVSQDSLFWCASGKVKSSPGAQRQEPNGTTLSYLIAILYILNAALLS